MVCTASPKGCPPVSPSNANRTERRFSGTISAAPGVPGCTALSAVSAAGRTWRGGAGRGWKGIRGSAAGRAPVRAKGDTATAETIKDEKSRPTPSSLQAKRMEILRGTRHRHHTAEGGAGLFLTEDIR